MCHFSIDFLELAVSCLGLGGADVIILLEPCIDCRLGLFTDLWRSPIHRIATHIFSGNIVVPSAWDSGLPLLMFIECTIAAVQEIMWDTVKNRTDALETAFDQTKLFRKFT